MQSEPIDDRAGHITAEGLYVPAPPLQRAGEPPVLTPLPEVPVEPLPGEPGGPPRI